MNTKTILVSLASFIAGVVFAVDPPSVGSAAPDFSLTDAKGNTHSLSQYKGKTVVLEWLDPEGKAGRAYGAKNTPNMVIINPEGKISYEGAIDSKATPNPADIPNSTNYVKVALDESLEGKPVTTSTTKPYGCSVKYKSS